MPVRRLPIAALALAAAAPSIAPAAVPAPRMQAQTFEQIGKLPLPYDGNADATAAIARARARAKAEHKLLLIDLGGNWCLDCRLLAGTIEQPELRAFVDRHYAVVPVDIGRYDQNLAVPVHYGLGKRPAGVPSLLVIDPRTDKVLNAGHATALSDARHMNPQGLADYLAQWAR